MRSQPLALILSFTVGLATILLGACASGPSAATNTTYSILGAAGFRMHEPATASQKEIFATLPAYKVEEVVVDGQTFYVYKDAQKNVALVGHEAQYQRYRQMARQERLSASYHNVMM